MKSFIAACAAAILLAVVCGALLSGVQESADKAYSTTGVRLGA